MELANIYLGVVIILLLSIDGCHHYHSADGYHTSSINNRQSLLSLEAESNSSLISRGHGETIKTVPAKKGAIGLQFGQRSVIEAPICSFYGPRCTQARLNPEWFATTPPSTEGKHVDVLYLRDSYRQKDLSKSYRDAALVKETIYPLTPFLTAREVFDPAGKDSARVTYDFYALGTSDTARKRTLCLFYKWNMMLRIIGDKDLTHNFPHYTLYALRTFQGFPHVGVATRSIYFPKRKNGHRYVDTGRKLGTNLARQSFFK